MLKTQTSDHVFDTQFTKQLRIAIVCTDYHKEMNRYLEKHCRATLVKHGLADEHIKTFIAPGSWEIPLVAQAAAKTGNFDAIVTFGIIVKGDTYHFDMIANECGKAIMKLSLDYSLPIANEILAVYDIKDAHIRAADDDNNKGIEGAMAVLKTLQTLRSVVGE